MSSIDFLIPASTQVPSNSTSSRFNQKQAWLEELEKAQKLVDNNNDISEKYIQKSDKKIISNRGYVSEINETDDRGIQTLKADVSMKIDDANIKSAMEIINSPVKEQSGNGSISVLEGNAQGFNFTNSTANKVNRSVDMTMKLERMSSQLQTDYELQSINLIAGEKGVKIMLRDYRSNDKDLSKIIFKIKETLMDIGIKIEKIVLNGSDFNRQDVA